MTPTEANLEVAWHQFRNLFASLEDGEIGTLAAKEEFDRLYLAAAERRIPARPVGEVGELLASVRAVLAIDERTREVVGERFGTVMPILPEYEALRIAADQFKGESA